MSSRLFDLNIDKFLDAWDPSHALREVIANALDEQALTSTPEVEICKDDEGNWHVRDFGRGLSYEHLTQNENPEKAANTDRVVGQFGVGLKDALATFERRGVQVRIRSRHGTITLQRTTKHGFDDVPSLHARVAD